MNSTLHSSPSSDSKESVKAEASQKADEHRDKMRAFARMGYGARGVIYLMIGGLALMSALGGGGETTGSKGALSTLVQQPFGKVMLGIVAFGLLGYSCWRLIQTFKDPDGHGTSAKGIGVRTALFISAITHILLAIWSFSIVFTAGKSQSGNGGSSIPLLSSEFAPYVFAAVGVFMLVAGIAHIYKGWTSRFERYMLIPAEHQKWACPSCQFGLISRGVVWLIISGFFLNSFRQFSQGSIGGMGEAFDQIRSSPFGTWLLGLVALGIIAFGIYSFLEARYRKIEV